MTAPSPARTAGRGRASLAAMVLVAGLTTVFALAPVGAGAATTPPPTPPTPPGTVTFTLAPVAGGVAQVGGGATALVAVQNDTLGTLPAASVRLLVGEEAFAGRQEAAQWTLVPDARALQEVGSISLDAVAPGERRTGSLAVQAAGAAGSPRAPGVYPLLAVYGDGFAARSSASTIVVAEPPATTTPVGVVVPITAPPQTVGLIPPDQLAQYTAVDGTLTQQLDGVEGTGAILAVDPAVVASIRVLGDTAPETATAWLTRLVTLPNSRFPLQFGDADVAAQLHSGAGALLRPEPFDAQLDPADFDADQPDDASPTPGAAREPVLPDLEQLLDIGGPAAPAVYWPATGTADVAVVDRLVSQDASALVIVPSDTTGAAGGGAVVPARGIGTLVYDATISAALAASSRIDDPVVRGAELAKVAAQLAFALPGAGTSPLLVTLDRADGRSRVALRAAISAVIDTDGVVVDDLGDLVEATPAPVVVIAGGPDGSRAAAVDRLLADEAAVAGLATVLDDPRLLTAPQRASLLQVLGVGWLADGAAWQAALLDQRAATATTLGAVSIPPPTDVNLLTANSRLQFVVRNALEWPVTVTLVAQPDDPRLRVQRSTEVGAGAAADTRVVVPVESRVGSGDVTVDLRLVSPTGVAIGAADSVDVRVRAEWETFGIVALSVVVGGLVVLGVIRTVLRRRSHRTAGSEPTGAADGGT